MLAFLRHIQFEIKRTFPGIDMEDPATSLRITASVPETTSRSYMDRYQALIEEAWSTYGKSEVHAKVRAGNGLSVDA